MSNACRCLAVYSILLLFVYTCRNCVFSFMWIFISDLSTGFLSSSDLLEDGIRNLKNSNFLSYLETCFLHCLLRHTSINQDGHGNNNLFMYVVFGPLFISLVWPWWWENVYVREGKPREIWHDFHTWVGIRGGWNGQAYRMSGIMLSSSGWKRDQDSMCIDACKIRRTEKWGNWDRVRKLYRFGKS